MARLESVADQFPVGTSVAAYKVANWPAGQVAQHGFVGEALGSKSGSAKVASDGSWTIRGLTVGTDYVACAEVDGEYRYRRFREKRSG